MIDVTILVGVVLFMIVHFWFVAIHLRSLRINDGGNKMEKKKTVSKASTVLGILSIASGWLIPGLGLVLGIIGICIHKNTKGMILNIVGMSLSILFWFIYTLVILSMF